MIFFVSNMNAGCYFSVFKINAGKVLKYVFLVNSPKEVENVIKTQRYTGIKFE